MPERRVREVRRRVVSEKVLGSANPVAKWGRESKASCAGSISGFFFGLLLFFVGFAIPFFAARTEKDSRDIAKLDVITAEAAASVSGKALVSGTLLAVEPVTPPKGNSGPVAAFRYVVEDYETRPEKRTEKHTEVQDGKEVEVTEEVTEMVSDWVTKKDEKSWARLSLGSIIVDPARAAIDLPWETTFNETTLNDTHRERVEVIRGGISVLLAAEFDNGQVVAQPDFYRLAAVSKDELVTQMNKAEESNRWLLIALSVIVWTASFNLLAGPAMLLFNVLPVKGIGAALRGVITFFSFLIACMMTWVVYVAVRFWWLILIVLVAVVVVLIVSANKRKAASVDLEPPPAQP